jgi:two-component system nitrogen regulation response regulator GlnG
MAPAQMIEAKDLPPEVLATLPDAPKVANVPPAALSGFSATHDMQPAQQPVFVAVALASPADGHLLTTSSSDGGHWEADLAVEALALLASGQTDVWDVLTRRFESKLIQTALVNTRGRRIEAAQKLGIGRNTITRKIQELGLE